VAFAAAAALDVKRRLVVQAWQIEHQLGVPLLAELGKP
jgi:hypothetical protein